MYSLREKVEAGIQLLDHENPSWWLDIDPDGLDMQSVDACVLGQLYERYSEGKKALGITLGEPFGFALGNSTLTPFENRKKWRELRELWVESIEARLLSEELRASELAIA